VHRSTPRPCGNFVISTLDQRHRARVVTKQDVHAEPELMTYVDSLDDLLGLVQAWWQSHWDAEWLGSSDDRD
jgi:hypothetical protein